MLIASIINASRDYWVYIGLKGLRYFGAKLWNNIFLSFTDIYCVDLFMARFKGMLLDSNFLEENMTSCI